MDDQLTVYEFEERLLFLEHESGMSSQERDRLILSSEDDIAIRFLDIDQFLSEDTLLILIECMDLSEDDMIII